MHCEFDRVAERVYKCRHCGKLSMPPVDRPPRRECTAAIEMPSLLSRARNYIGSTRRWIANGRRYASPDQVAERLRICQACDLVERGTHCKKCGCPLAHKARRLVEKEASDCPIKRWPVIYRSDSG